MRPADTDPAAAEVQLRLLRGFTPARRALLVDAMCRDMRSLAMAGLRQRHPGASPRHLLDALTRRLLADDLADAVIQERDRREHGR